METLNTTTCSTLRTGYGSTTLNITIDNGDTTGLSNPSETTTTTSATTTHGIGYQSLPYSSSTNLFAKSRFTKMSVDTTTKTESYQLLQRLEYFLNVLNQICIGFVTIYMSWLCLNTGLVKTSLHAFLSTIGFCFLMAEGIMSHYNNNIVTTLYRRNTKTTIHWVLQALGGGIGIAGILVKCIQKNFSLHTVHGKLGFATLILCCISLVSGLSALYSTKIKNFFSPLLNKTFHNILGIGTFILALASQYYGYNTGFFSFKAPSPDFIILIKVITLMLLLLTCLGPLKALYYKTLTIIQHYK